jgi:hypothetical protein
MICAVSWSNKPLFINSVQSDVHFGVAAQPSTLPDNDTRYTNIERQFSSLRHAQMIEGMVIQNDNTVPKKSSLAPHLYHAVFQDTTDQCTQIVRDRQEHSQRVYESRKVRLRFLWACFDKYSSGDFGPSRTPPACVHPESGTWKHEATLIDSISTIESTY